MHDAQAVVAIGDQREHRRVHAADLHRARVVHRAAGVEHLVETRSLRILDVDDREAFRAVRHIGVGARDVELLRVVAADDRAAHRHAAASGLVMSRTFSPSSSVTNA